MDDDDSMCQCELDDYVDDDDNMDYEPTASSSSLPKPKASQPIPIHIPFTTTPPIVCRKPLIAPKGYTPIIDIFLLAVILNHGVRLVDNAIDAFDIYDYKRYFEFSQSIPNQREHHARVTPYSRLKALRVWLTGSTEDLLTHVMQGISHKCYRMQTLASHKDKIAQRYEEMLLYVEEFL
jgi:hypothetical protein